MASSLTGNIFFTVILLGLISECYCIPLNQFLPYGRLAGDTVFSPNDDDQSEPGKFSYAFLYFKRTYNNFYIKNNGFITFEKLTTRQYTPVRFPLSYPIIAPYWADVDTRGTGIVWYRSTSDPEIILRVRNEIAVAFPQLMFMAREVLIVTWDNVGYFDQKIDKTNTFQCILATDGVLSFVLFLYADDGIQWTTGDASGGVGGFGGTPAQAGFDAGNLVDFTVINGSFTDDIVNIDKISNVDIPGMFVFQVNGEKPGVVSIKPDYGNQLGGTPVIIYGLLFGESSNISCLFGDVAALGVKISDTEAMCISPKLDTNGYIPVKILVDETGYLVAFHSLHYSKFADVTIKTQDNSLIIHSENHISLSWNQSSIFPLSNSEDKFTVDISIYEGHVRYGSSVLWTPLNFTGANSGFINNGSAVITLPSFAYVKEVLNMPFRSPYFLVLMKLAINSSSIESKNNLYLKALKKLNLTSGESVGKWSHVLFRKADPQSDGEFCLEWLNKDFDKINLIEEDLEACPCNTLQAGLPLSGFDERNSPELQILDQFLHEKDAVCYEPKSRNKSAVDGVHHKCCYDESGNLIVGAPYGGSVDSRSSTDNWEQHFLFDISTYLVCCIGSKKGCIDYYNKRPFDNCSTFDLAATGWMFGDPHLETLDKYSYTFNGRGEYILIETLNNRFTLQGRMIPAENIDQADSLGTVFSAVVAKEINSDTLEFRANTAGIEVLINSQEIEFEGSLREEFNNVTVAVRGINTIGAVFTSGAYLEVKQELGYLSSVKASLHPLYYNLTRGLLGVYNKDINDDLLPRYESNPLPLNSTMRTIHNEFGLTWIISNATDSLFTYSPTTNFSTYYDPDFTPMFEATFSNITLEEEANETCRGDSRCLFDIAATGRADVGNTTARQVEIIQNEVVFTSPIICIPPCVRGACVANNTCNCPFGYKGDLCEKENHTKCEIANPCINNGTCVQHIFKFYCICEPPYFGRFCEKDNSMDSLLHVFHWCVGMLFLISLIIRIYQNQAIKSQLKMPRVTVTRHSLFSVVLFSVFSMLIIYFCNFHNRHPYPSPLPFVEVLHTIKFQVAGGIQFNQHWKGYGISVYAPLDALPRGYLAEMVVRITLSGPFLFLDSKNWSLSSAVYWISSSKDFLQPITIGMKYSKKPFDDSLIRVVMASDSTENDNYIFEIMEGQFDRSTSYGYINVTDFSTKGLACLEEDGSDKYIIGRLLRKTSSSTLLEFVFIIFFDSPEKIVDEILRKKKFKDSEWLTVTHELPVALNFSENAVIRMDLSNFSNYRGWKLIPKIIPLQCNVKRLCVSKDEEQKVLAELGFFALWERKGSEYIIDTVVELPLFGTIHPKYLTIILNPNLLGKSESIHTSNNNEGAYLDDGDFLLETDHVVHFKDVAYFCVILGVHSSDCDEITSVYRTLHDQLFNVELKWKHKEKPRWQKFIRALALLGCCEKAESLTRDHFDFVSFEETDKALEKCPKLRNLFSMTAMQY